MAGQLRQYRGAGRHAAAGTRELPPPRHCLSMSPHQLTDTRAVTQQLTSEDTLHTAFLSCEDNKERTSNMINTCRLLTLPVIHSMLSYLHGKDCMTNICHLQCGLDDDQSMLRPPLHMHRKQSAVHAYLQQILHPMEDVWPHEDLGRGCADQAGQHAHIVKQSHALLGIFCSCAPLDKWQHSMLT